VALLLPNGVDMVCAVLGVLEAGGVVMPLGSGTKEHRLRVVLGDARPAGLLTHVNLASAWEPVVAEMSGVRTIAVAGADVEDGRVVPLDRLTGDGLADPGTIDQDLAALLYTSGSTGAPKGVMLSHRNVASAMTSIQAYLGIRPDDVVLCALPLSFGYGLTQLLLAFAVGASLVLEGFAFPVRVLEALARERATVFAAVPTMWASLLALETVSRHDLGALRILTNAGAGLSAERVQAVRSAFPQARLFPMYGQTECIRVTYLDPADLDRRPGSVGRGMPNQEVWLVDEKGRRLPPGNSGELVVRGSHVMRGYWDMPEETARKLRPGVLPGEAVLHTGDLFRMDEDGYLYFVSRADDIIKTRGEKVAPKEVEDALLRVPGVREAAVVGVPDVLLGEAVHAFVALAEGASLGERDLVKHCLATLESFMAPKVVTVLPELPKTPNGKLDKPRLREMSYSPPA
jgi:amino acid adenylation domain-containing protein